MVECIFTLDYEIYGDGTGSLKELIYDPAKELQQIFQQWNARFVAFVEVLELEKIEQLETDPAIEQVKDQIAELHREGFEIALHLHPQWCNAQYAGDGWTLDYSEYNLCTLPKARMREIVRGGLAYLRHILREPDFVPLAFRAGNWLFQPTQSAADVLAEHGIRVDSSVFKGGVQHKHGLDYRPARRNGDYWRFSADANCPDPAGVWIEVPIYTEMVPPWSMATSKRMAFRGGRGAADGGMRERFARLRDRLRWHYPRKFDFCRMTFAELKNATEKMLREDRHDSQRYRPMVAIGHTKDLTDAGTVDNFLRYLASAGVSVTTFRDAWPRLAEAAGGMERLQVGNWSGSAGTVADLLNKG